MLTHHSPEHAAFPALESLSVTADLSDTRTVVITARGEVDRETSPLLQTRLCEWIRRSGPDLVVDLLDVRHFGAAGITVLLRAAASAETAGVEFLVVATGRAVLMPLRVTGLLDAFGLHPTVSHALRHIAGALHPRA
ncbi:MAG: STAS domain-containing protein [Umezawaea sp.]